MCTWNQQIYSAHIKHCVDWMFIFCFETCIVEKLNRNVFFRVYCYRYFEIRRQHRWSHSITRISYGLSQQFQLYMGYKDRKLVSKHNVQNIWNGYQRKQRKFMWWFFRGKVKNAENLEKRRFAAFHSKKLCRAYC